MLDATPLPNDPQPGDVPEPRGPWSFLAQALPGGFGPWGLQLLLGWLGFHVLTSALWAAHLRAAAGSSALPAYWGELITVRDVWELVENGGLKQSWTGPWAPLAALLCCAWFLWASWKVQAGPAGVRARLAPWLWGFLDALILAAVPLWIVGAIVLWALSGLASTGIQGLGWLNWVGGALVRLAIVSTFFLQAWICRLARAQEGGKGRFSDHLRTAFLRLWKHPIQWFALVTGGVAVRAGLPFLALLLGWRMGGGTALRVWGFLGLQALAVLIDAWLIGWFLRVTALFWRNDTEVQAVIRDLEAGK